MSRKGRVQGLEGKLAGGTRLWGECDSCAQFCLETWGDAPPSPGAKRLQVALVLSATPMMLASDRPEQREEGLEILQLNPEQADNEVEQNKRISEIAISAGFTKPELKSLRRWVADKRAMVKEMQAIAERVKTATVNRKP
jgi:hypothetical protein